MSLQSAGILGSTLRSPYLPVFLACKRQHIHARDYHSVTGGKGKSKGKGNGKGREGEGKGSTWIIRCERHTLISINISRGMCVIVR